MANNDRVEPKTMLVGRGSGVTPESLADLEQRARAHARLHRQRPQKSFGEVLGRAGGEAPAPALSRKEERRQSLPKRGPRPSLAHPGMRDAYGREDVENEPVVLKG